MTNTKLAEIMKTMSVFALSVSYGNETKIDWFSNAETDKALDFIGDIDVEYADYVDISTALNVITVKFPF